MSILHKSVYCEKAGQPYSGVSPVWRDGSIVENLHMHSWQNFLR